jgi:hypothetical protein
MEAGLLTFTLQQDVDNRRHANQGRQPKGADKRMHKFKVMDASDKKTFSCQ